MTAILNPIDTGKQMWGAVEAAWERDVINGDARSRAEFFSYGVVSVIGVKGLDKLGKAGKLGNAASKANNALPYNAMKTDKLKETLKSNVYSTVQQKTQQAADFWKSNFSKEAINKTIEAAKNSAVITKAKNTLNPANIKAATAKTYEVVVKTPIAKTQVALKAKKEQLLDMPLPNFGLASVPLGPTMNMTVREGIEAAKDTVVQIVGGKDGGGERNKDADNLKFKDSYYVEHTTGPVEKFTERNGLSGGHNYEEFKNYFNSNSNKYELEAVVKKEHPDIDGIFDIEYKVKYEKMDYTGKNGTGEYKVIPNGEKVYKKTVYEPTIISNEEIIELSKKAMEEGLYNKREIPLLKQKKIKILGQTELNGKELKFEGIMNSETGEIENAYPVLDWVD